MEKKIDEFTQKEDIQKMNNNISKLNLNTILRKEGNSKEKKRTVFKNQIKTKFSIILNKNHNIFQNIGSSIKSERKNSQTNLLGQKKKNSNDQKLLSISRPITHCIHRTKIKNISNCPICLQKVYLRDKNTGFLGHIFHCACINKWIKSGKNECPFCRLKIYCPLHQKSS